jgi:hypothetical protein
MIERESEVKKSESPEFEDDPVGVGFRTLFKLDDEEFEKFLELLDSPTEPSDGLRKLMSMKPRWEQ